MRVSIDLATGLLIESSSCSTIATMTSNAHALGYVNVQVKDVTDSECDVLIAARNKVKI